MKAERALMPGMAFTVATLAGRWSCSEGVIRKLIGDRQLACFRVGALIRISPEEVRRFELQNIPSNDSAADLPSSIAEPTESEFASGYEQPTVLGLKRKRGEDGERATVHRGPWAGS